jgi:hypothetical protein
MGNDLVELSCEGMEAGADTLREIERGRRFRVYV